MIGWSSDTSIGIVSPLGCPLNSGQLTVKVDFNRLYTSGVTGLQILAETLAVWLFSCRRPHALPDDSRLTYALGIAILYLASRDRREVWTNGQAKDNYKLITGTARKATGEALRTTLLPLLLNVQVYFEKADAKDGEFRSALMTKF